MAKQEIEMHGLEEDQVDEMDFGSIGKTLSKYGKGVPVGEPKKPTRSTVHTDYTMTGHQEKKSSTGRVYTKAPEMDREPEAIKATAKVDQVEAPKRGRGRPAGATNKNGTGKGWSAEAKASMKAKLAARKAAKLAANESEFIEEDWADIVEDQSLDAIVEFMMEEEYQSLDELSKKTLGSYIKKASRDQATAAGSQAIHRVNGQKEFADEAGAARKKRRIGVDKATDRLTKESEEIDEANKPVSTHVGTFSTMDRNGNPYQLDTYKVSNGTHRYNLHNPKTGVYHSAAATIKNQSNAEADRTLNAVAIHAGKGDHKTALEKLNANSYHKWSYHGKNESVEELNITRYAALIGKNLIKE